MSNSNNSNNASPLSQTKLADLPGMAPQDSAQLELQPEQILAGRYEIKELIGQGGMGAVYRAFDKNTDKDIALKLLLPSLLKNDSARERFLSEAKISQQLSHPNIVNVFDVQSEENLFFLTMELLQGQDLRQWLDNLKALNQPTPIDEVKRIASELCEALTYAHEFTVHRDIKPENIWLDESGKVKLMDFGIARVQSASQRTQTGAAMGTAYYMAPEQLQGRELDARADLYAVGVMLYEMLTGQIPAGRFESAMTLRKEIGKGLNNTIDKALSVNPEQRFASASELQAALHSGKAGKLKSTHAHSGGPNKLAIAAVVLLLAGGMGVAAQQGWLDAFKPLDRELIAQQKAEATKLLGQVNALQKRLDNSLRDLDRDVSEAKREGNDRYTTLQSWQDKAEDYITGSNTLTDLLGELAVGEGYLRDDSTTDKAVATLTGVKTGYEHLLNCFDGLEGFENQQAELQTLQNQWQGYEIGGQMAADVKAMEARMTTARTAGHFCENVTLTVEAIAAYQTLLRQAAPTIAAQQAAQQAQNDWQAHTTQYHFTGTVPEADTAQQRYKQADTQRSEGELVASAKLYQQAQEAWQQAWQNDAMVDWVAAQKEQAKRDAEAKQMARRVAKVRTLDEAKAFLQQYPSGPYARQVREKDYWLVTNKRTQHANSGHKNPFSNTRTERFEYDEWGNIVTSSYVSRNSGAQTSNFTRTCQYNALGQVTACKENYNNSLSQEGYEYNDLGQLVARTWRRGDNTPSTKSYQYDDRGNKVLVTDPNGTTTSFKYDNHDRLVRSWNSHGGQTIYTYNRSGQLSTRTHKNPSRFAVRKEVRSYQYDSDQRLIQFVEKKDWSDSEPTSTTTTYEYDAVGLLQHKSTNSVSQGKRYSSMDYNYVYDDNRQLMREEQSGFQMEEDRDDDYKVKKNNVSTTITYDHTQQKIRFGEQ